MNLKHFGFAVCASILAANPGIPAFAQSVTVHIDPKIEHGTWEGWGTALCWWGKAFGNRTDVADLLFTTNTVDFNGEKLPGLGLNIVRYNAGACSWNDIDGRKMTVSNTFFPYRQMEGYWLDGASDDPQSISWNWNVDSNQRASMINARDRGATRFELFSNSPMWWMCKNGNPSGGPTGMDNNLPPDKYSAFAVYLATIAKYAKDHWGITFTSVEPLNEPISPFWSAKGKQEGCHFSDEAQAGILQQVRAELDKRGLTEMPIAASDENTYDEAVATWNSFGPATRALINQVNVHGYQGEKGRRDVLFDLASKEGKRLWNSEYGDVDGTGLKLAHNLGLDFRYLHPTAWCYWQPFDMKGWGFVLSDMFSGKIFGTNPKYFVVAQYTRHIRPGMTMLETGDSDTVAAYDPKARKLVLIAYCNVGCNKTFDLSRFTSASGPVTRWITEPKGASRYQIHQDLTLSGRSLNAALPDNSVETFEIANVMP